MVAGTGRQVIILLITFLKQSAFPVRISLRQAFGILVYIRICILLRLLFAYPLIQLEVNQPFMYQFTSFLASHQRTIRIGKIGYTIFGGKVYPELTFLSFLGSDQHYSISTFRTIQRSRGGILQHGDTFNIRRIQRFNNSHSTCIRHRGKVTQVIRGNRYSVQYIQRFSRSIHGSDSPHPQGRFRTGLRRGSGHHTDTRHIRFNHLRHGHHRQCLQLFRSQYGSRSRIGRFLKISISCNDHLVQGIGILFQYNMEISFSFCRNILCQISYIAHYQ